MQKENKQQTKYNPDNGQMTATINKSEDKASSLLTAFSSITKKIKKVTIMPTKYTTKNCMSHSSQKSSRAETKPSKSSDGPKISARTLTVSTSIP